ncbi:MAG: hypothetical protein PVJ60_07535 [Phycisphaerales bacterium]|jgi:hypothetical protein
MAKNEEDKIKRQLEMLSQIEPSPKAAGRAVKRVRDALLNEESKRQDAGTKRYQQVFNNPFVKFVAAAVFLFAVGCLAGRLSAPAADIEELRAALEPAIRESLLTELNGQWQSAFAVNCAQIKEELHQQVRRDLTEFAAQTLAASSAMTNRSLNQLIELIEAARVRERQQVATALEQIEQERAQIKNGLLTLAARTSELRRTEQN